MSKKISSRFSPQLFLFGFSDLFVSDGPQNLGYDKNMKIIRAARETVIEQILIVERLNYFAIC